MKQRWLTTFTARGNILAVHGETAVREHMNTEAGEIIEVAVQIKDKRDDTPKWVKSKLFGGGTNFGLNVGNNQKGGPIRVNKKVREAVGGRSLDIYIFEDEIGKWFVEVPDLLAQGFDLTEVKFSDPPNKPTHSPTLSAEGWAAKQFLNLILAGVPGTGKTHSYVRLCEELRVKVMNDAGEMTHNGDLGTITFHPNTAYEDFIEGIRPSTGRPTDEVDLPPAVIGAADGPYFFDEASKEGNNTEWSIQDGFFLRACGKAARNPHKIFAVLIDEINRANLPKVLGDLLTTLERTKRATKHTADAPIWDVAKAALVTLPLSGRKFFVPDNLYIIATMNTTDRSVTPLDVALRRRFAYKRLDPLNKEALSAAIKKVMPNADKDFDEAVDLYANLNEAIGRDDGLGADAKIGHSYFIDAAKDVVAGRATSAKEALLATWQYAVLPQFFETLRAFGRTEIFGVKQPAGKSQVVWAELAKFEKDFTFTHVAGMMESLTIDRKPSRNPAAESDT